MIYILSILLSLLPQKIRVATSVDWLCYEANTIAIVKVDDYKEEDFKINNYNSIGTVTATITKILKGKKLLHNKVIIYTKNKFIGSDSWPLLKGKEVLVFLKDIGCEGQCVYSIIDKNNALIDLTDTKDKAITGVFSVLKKQTDIETYINNCVEKLKGKAANPFYLEVSYNTEAYNSLYSGSSCYLIVPDILYPTAKKEMN